MSKPYFVKFDTPKELVDASYEALRQAQQTGKIRKGTNEATKAIERGVAKLVVISEDVEPPEVVAHLPILCDEMKVPYIFVPDKRQIGNSLGLDVGAAAACIVEPGDAQAMIDQVVASLAKVQNKE